MAMHEGERTKLERAKPSARTTSERGRSVADAISNLKFQIASPEVKLGGGDVSPFIGKAKRASASRGGGSNSLAVGGGDVSPFNRRGERG
jgi:hypothetical protein